MSQRLSQKQIEDLAVVGRVSARASAGHDDASVTQAKAVSRGVETLSGRLTAREAAIQVLTLPVLILGWGLAVAVIIAFI